MRPVVTTLDPSEGEHPTAASSGATSSEHGVRAVPALVDAAWAVEHLTDPTVRFVEVDDRPGRHRHRIPGSVAWAWDVDLCDPILRDLAGPDQLAALLGRSGIDPRSHIVLYGDPANWFAAWAYWLLKMHGIETVSLLDGGRTFWIHRGLPLTTDGATPGPATFPLGRPSFAFRAMRADVLERLADPGTVLVDVRGPREYSGELIAPPGMTETAQRGGHIPGAVSIPWDLAVNDDGTFKDRDRLLELYEAAGVEASKDVIVYCRIGERSSHSWFVLHEILGYPNVRNYDGSWTEWGSSVGLPIER